MPLPRSLAGWAAALALLLGGNAARAGDLDPLRLVPAEADLFVQVEKPRQLVEAFTTLDAYKQAERLDFAREILDSTLARRFYQFVAYYEKDLGTPWPELLDKLAGGGIVLGVKFQGTGQPKALLVVQGTDPALTAKFKRKALALLDQELTRLESKDRPQAGKYRDVETIRLGNAHIAVHEATLLIAGEEPVLHLAVDRLLASREEGKTPPSMATAEGPAKARKILPPDPLIRAYLNFKPIRQLPGAKDVFATPRNDFGQTLLAGGILDTLGRADFVTAGLYRRPDGFVTTIRLPAGRKEMPTQSTIHVPAEGKPGTLPLLEPKGVFFSHSFYLDTAAVWEKRDVLMNEAVRKGFENGIKQGSRFLPGTSIDKLLTQMGPYHRIVYARPAKGVYKTETKLPIGSFAYVVSMKDPAFAKSAEGLIRAGALFAGTQVSLTLAEEKHNGVRVFGYRFAEDGKFPGGDPQNVRFNFSPSFAAVGDQFLAASSIDLCRELIDALQKPDANRGLPANMQMRLYATGIAESFYDSPEQVRTSIILSQAVPVAEADKQMKILAAYLQKLGTLRFETNYDADSFRFDIGWKFGK